MPRPAPSGDASAAARSRAKRGPRATRASRYAVELLEERVQLSRVVTIGDSWAGFIANGAPGSMANSGTGNSLQAVLNAFGTGQTVYNGSFYGGTAGQMASSLADITARINAAGPDCDVVYLSLGGNDMLLGTLGGGWWVQMGAEAETALFENIRASTNTVVHHILSLRPDIQIVISSYDYINFWDTTNEQIGLIRGNLGMGKSGVPLLDGQQNAIFNNALRNMEQRKIDVALASSRVHHVNNMGLNHLISGYSGYFGNWPAGIVYPELPFDDQYIGSAGEDMIHQTTSGYNNIALNVYNNFFSAAFQAASLSTNTTTLDFGFVRVGTQASLGLTSTNVGPNFTKIKNLSYGAAGGDFSGGGVAFLPLFRDPTLGSDQATANYLYSPGDRGFDSTSISVTSDSGSRTVFLSGIGVGPQFSTQPSFGFANLTEYQPFSGVLTLANFSGDGDRGALTNLTLHALSFTGEDADLFSASGFTPGTILATSQATGVNIQFNGAAPGTYTANLVIQTDQGAAYGGVGEAFVVPITVTVVAGPPTALVTSIPALEGSAVLVTAQATGTVDLYEWDLDYDGVYETPGQSFSFTPLDNGTILFPFRVTGPGGTSAASTQVNVASAVPTATIAGPASGVRATSVLLTLAASDPSPLDQASSFTYQIDLNGDDVIDQTVAGSGAVQANILYQAAGEKTVRVRAIDKDGAVGAFTSHSLVIEKGNLSAQGGEAQANTFTAGAQTDPAIAADAVGNYVVVWTSAGQDGSSDGIYAQRYNASGAPIGTEFRVNPTTSGAQNRPAIAMDAVGNFTIVWQSHGQDGSDFGIYGRRYNGLGQPLSSEFLINTTTADRQARPAIAMNGAGEFVVAWQSANQDGSGLGVFARKYSATGGAISGEIAVNTTTAADQRNPKVAVDAAGGFVVTWTSGGGQDGGSDGVYARRFAAGGAPASGEILVNTTTAGSQQESVAAASPTGAFLIAWTSSGQDGSGTGVYARRFDAAGSPLGGEFRVPQTTSGDPRVTAAGATADGDYFVVWDSIGQDGFGSGVYARRFHSSGVALGPEFRVNTTTAGDQKAAAAAVNPSGHVAVAWQSAGQDGSGDGIFVQRFRYFGVGNQAPTATIHGPYAVVEGGSVVLSASASDLDGDALWYLWDLNGDGVFGEVAGSNPTVPWSRIASLGIGDGPGGVLDVRVRVGDGTAVGTSDATSMTFTNAAPAAGIVGPAIGFLGQSIEFSLTAFDPSPADQAAGFQFEIDWDGDDVVDELASGLSGVLAAHAFGSTGAYTIKVRATDKDGGVSDFFEMPILIQSDAIARVGGETAVNTTTIGSQYSPRVAADAAGRHVVVWTSFGQDGSVEGIYGRLFGADGLPLAPEFRVNTFTPGAQIRPAVAMAASGSFVVVWQSHAQDGSEFGIRAQRYNAEGAPVGGEIAVNSFTAGNQIRPSVAMHADGSFVVVWQSADQDGSGFGIFGQRFASDGSPIGSEFPVNVYTINGQRDARVAATPAGGFIVTWTSAGQDGSGDGVYLRRFDSAGSPASGDVLVNTRTSDKQENSALAVDALGRALVAWTGWSQDGSGAGIFAQLFDAAGAPLGGEFRVNDVTAGNQTAVAVAVDPAGDFVVSWQSDGQDGSSTGVYVRTVGAAGQPTSQVFLANTTVAGAQAAPAVAAGGGRVLVVWQSAGQDGSGDGIFRQRFQFAGGDRVAGPSLALNSTDLGASGRRLRASAPLAEDAVDGFFSRS